MTAANAAPFDGNAYRKTVLAVIDARGGPQTSDPFEYYDLPLEDDDTLTDAAVAAQLDAVWAFWQKQRDHPKYRGLVSTLLAGHDEVAPRLRQWDTRRWMADDVRRLRAERDGARFAELDGAIERLVERFGGIPRGKLDGLRGFAAAAGLAGPGTEDRLARHPLMDDVAPAPAVPELAAVYRQVRDDLDELGQLLGSPPPVSLYHLLGLPPAAARDQVAAERALAAADNRERRPDRRRALVDDLLAAVAALLIDGDPDAYLDAVAAEVTARLRPRLVAAVLVEDELTAADREQLVAEAEAGGLDRGRAVQVLAELAREAGVQVPPAGPVGERVGEREAAARAAEQGRPAGAGAWLRELSEARAALRSGHAGRAQARVDAARRLAGGMLPPIRAVADEVAEVLAEAAQRWRGVEAGLAAGRFTDVAVALERLVRIAVDVPGPQGVTVSEALSQARAGLTAAGERLADAAALTGAARELALLEAARLAPDHAGVLTELRAVPVAPPTGVRAQLIGGGVLVRWQASASPGQLDYSVRRADGQTVGTTSQTELEDGQPAGGELPVYVVTARRAGVLSQPATSSAGALEGFSEKPVELPPSVPSLLVVPMGGRLRLLYPSPAGGRAEVRRLADGVPVPAPGTLVPDPAQLGDLVPGMAPGLAVDRRPSATVVRYLVLSLPTGADGAAADGPAVAGAMAAYVEVPPVTGLHEQQGRLHWQWPPGCTEVMFTWRDDAPPEHAADPRATGRRLTNARYQIDDGVPAPPRRPTHVAVFTTRRVDGTLHAACDAPSGARLQLGGAG